MGHYRFYELDQSDHITVGYSIECGSDAAAMRAARTLLERAAGVEVWKSNHRVAHLSVEARQLWDTCGKIGLPASRELTTPLCSRHAGRLHTPLLRRGGADPGLVKYNSSAYHRRAASGSHLFDLTGVDAEPYLPRYPHLGI
jgi:hypothetical protein